MTETFYAVADWHPGQDLQPDSDGRVHLFGDLETAVELAGEYGGLVLEVTVEPGVVTRDPWGGDPYATSAIRSRCIRVLGS